MGKQETGRIPQAQIRREEGDICRRNQAIICLIFLKNCVLGVVFENFLGEHWVCILPIIFFPPVPSDSPSPIHTLLFFISSPHIYFISIYKYTSIYSMWWIHLCCLFILKFDFLRSENLSGFLFLENPDTSSLSKPSLPVGLHLGMKPDVSPSALACQLVLPFYYLV